MIRTEKKSRGEGEHTLVSILNAHSANDSDSEVDSSH